MTKDISTRIAHTAQIVVASAACVVDPTGVTLAAAATSGALSLPEIFKHNPDAEDALAKPIAKALKKSLKKPTFHMPADGPKLLPQMLDKAKLTPDDLAKCGLNPDLILGMLLDRHVDPLHRSGEMAEAFCNWLRPPLTDLLGNADFVDKLAPNLWAVALGDLRHIRAKVDRLEQESRKTAEALGLTKGLVMGLARRIAPSVDDFDTAMRELERAIGLAADMEARKHTASNTDDLVDQVMRKMTALNEADNLDGAAIVAEEALKAWQQEQERQKAVGQRLVEIALDQDILRRNIPAIVTRLAQQVQMHHPDRSQQFDALRAVQDQWYEKGRDMGLALELEVSIGLAQHSYDLAMDATQRGIALIDLGTATQVLGERESGTARLDQAVQAYENALQEWTQARVPLKWATTQNNLGNALATLGERETGTARLDQAVQAFENALQERTQARVPLDWAMTQNNLGTALRTLGERETGTARLEQAVQAYENALQERTQARVPLKWATTQNNLGNALKTLGQRETGTARLAQAVQAFENALQERTQARVPLKWAATQSNLAGVYLAYFDKTQDVAKLGQAEEHVRAALEVFEQAAPHYAGMAQSILDKITKRRG